jgi:hypothetical protein
MVGLAYKPFDGREGRLHARVAAIALQAGEQRRLLAALIRAGAAMDDDAQVGFRAENLRAEEALFRRFLDRLDQPRVAEVILAANVDEGDLRLDRKGAHDDAFDQLVRVVLHDDAVFEGARLRLVGVDDEVTRHGRRQEAPLHARREARAAAPADAARLDLLDDLFGFHGRQHAFGGFVAAIGDVGVDGVAVLLADACGEEAFLHPADAIRPRRFAREFGIARGRPAFERGEMPCRLHQVEHLLHILGGVQLLEVANLTRFALGDGDHRRGAARAETFHVIQAVVVVGGGFAVVDAQLLLEGVHALAGATQHTRDVGADLDVILALRFGVEHVVEVHHRANFRRLDFQNRRKFVLCVDRAVAELPLDHVERRQDRRTLAASGVEIHPLLDFNADRFR